MTLYTISAIASAPPLHICLHKTYTCSVHASMLALGLDFNQMVYRFKSVSGGNCTPAAQTVGMSHAAIRNYSTALFASAGAAAAVVVGCSAYSRTPKHITKTTRAALGTKRASSVNHQHHHNTITPATANRVEWRGVVLLPHVYFSLYVLLQNPSIRIESIKKTHTLAHSHNKIDNRQLKITMGGIIIISVWHWLRSLASTGTVVVTLLKLNFNVRKRIRALSQSFAKRNRLATAQSIWSPIRSKWYN